MAPSKIAIGSVFAWISNPLGRGRLFLRLLLFGAIRRRLSNLLAPDKAASSCMASV
jgi:hypothetical protein